MDFDLKELKNTRSSDRNLVFGYCRRAHQELFPMDNPYYDIKPLIIYICLAFYYIKWDDRDLSNLYKALAKIKFSDLDIDGNNVVNKNQWTAYFDKQFVIDIDEKMIDILFDSINDCGDGEITALEFFKWKTKFSKKGLVKLSSKHFDINPVLHYRKKRNDQRTNGTSPSLSTNIPINSTDNSINIGTQNNAQDDDSSEPTQNTNQCCILL